MERKKATPKPARYYAHDKRAYARMVELGVNERAIYEGWEPEQHWTKIRMNRGERLGVLDGLRGFGGAVKIRDAAAHFHGQGVTIVDIETGFDSMTHGISMRDAAMQVVLLSPEEKAARCRADAIRRQMENGGLPEREALVHWRNADLTTEDALKKIGWTKSMAFKILKARGIPAGRKPLQAAE